MDYFKVIENGKSYACVICGTIYDGWGARHQAKSCCSDKKPVSLQAIRQAEEILASKHHMPTPRLQKEPGEGIRFKDRWGHWRRGKPGSAPQTRAEYHKAFSHIEKQIKQEEIARLNQLMPPDPVIERTPRQKLAYAIITGNYEAAARAAEEISTSARANAPAAPSSAPGAQLLLSSISFQQFNLLFLAELNRYRLDLKHTGTGHSFHPLLRRFLLRAVKQDLSMDGFPATLTKWRHFILGKEAHELERSISSSHQERQ